MITYGAIIRGYHCMHVGRGVQRVGVHPPAMVRKGLCLERTYSTDKMWSYEI